LVDTVFSSLTRTPLVGTQLGRSQLIQNLYRLAHAHLTLVNDTGVV
jgi:hypothetical protein